MPLEEGNTKVSIVCSRAALCYLILRPCLYLYLEIKCGLKTSMWSSWWEGVNSWQLFTCHLMSLSEQNISGVSEAGMEHEHFNYYRLEEKEDLQSSDFNLLRVKRQQTALFAGWLPAFFTFRQQSSWFEVLYPQLDSQLCCSWGCCLYMADGRAFWSPVTHEPLCILIQFLLK